MGNGIRGRGIGLALYSGNCCQIFQRFSPSIPGNVAKHSTVCCQIFQGMFSNIPGNVAKHSGESHQTFRGMLPKILRNVAKPSGKYCQKLRGMPSNIPWNALKHSLFIINNVAKGQAFKVNGRGLIMRRSFIYLFHRLQSIWHRLKSTLNGEL